MLVFAHSSVLWFKRFLSEDAGPNTLVATVHAMDLDSSDMLHKIAGGNKKGDFDLESQKSRDKGLRMRAGHSHIHHFI